MKITRLTSLIVMLLCTATMYTQNLELTKNDSIVKSSWIFGIGFNAVDDAGSEFTNFFNLSDNWNAVPYPSRLSIGRYFENGLGLEAIGTYNRYKEGKIIDNTINTEDINYFAIDFRASYDLNKIIGQTGVFDPYVGLGAGYTDANNQGRGTFNTTVGFRIWFNDKIGIDLNSTGKWATNTDNASNHLQHAAGLVYQFKAKKGLSKKGEEKLAQIQEFEKEQQRIQDSITIEQENESKAKELAARLEKEKAAAAKARSIENEKLELEKKRKLAIQEELSNIGNVYFDFNSSFINDESKKVLQKMGYFLKKYPDVNLNIVSHTDSRGSESYNQWLSERRVQRTKDYLISKGLSADRIRGKGLGESSLLNPCGDNKPCTESQHRENRRSEFLSVTF